MNKKITIAWIGILSLLFSACANHSTTPNPEKASESSPSSFSEHQTLKSEPDPLKQIEKIKQTYQNQSPIQWGERMEGIISKLPTQEKVIALTFDACGGKHGSGFDEELINYLQANKIPATLFINSRWIKANPDIFQKLSKDPLFEIENHGTEHRPLSVNGRSIYGIQGTKNVTEVINEVSGNHQLIQQLTGRAPKFFRSGTAYYDNVSVQIAQEVGEKIAGFDVIGDAGATYNKTQVKKALLTAKSGSIVLLHMNMPSHETAEGLKEAIPLLQEKGYRFVQMQNYIH